MHLDAVPVRSALLALLVAVSGCRPPNVNEATTVKPLGADRHLITIVQDDGLEDSTITEYIALKAAEACPDGYEVEKQEDDHAVVRCDEAKPVQSKLLAWKENETEVFTVDEPVWCSLIDGDGPCYLTRPQCEEYVSENADARSCERSPSAVCFTATFITSGKLTTFCARQMGSCKTMRGLVDRDRYSGLIECSVVRQDNR